MSSPRFFSQLKLAKGLHAILPVGAARHAVKVLRMKTGDEVMLFDGTGGEYACRIAAVERERVTVDVLEWRDVECEAPFSVTLVQALQAGEKMDLTVQKAVELGVARIVPVISRRSVVRLEGDRALRRVEHWRAIAASACEQCGRNRVPEVLALETLERWLTRSESKGVRLLLDPASELTLHSLAAPEVQERVELLIGPEGGLTPEEAEKAIQSGFVGVRLGPRILRTETAGLAALSAIQCLWGDFNQGVGHV